MQIQMSQVISGGMFLIGITTFAIKIFDRESGKHGKIYEKIDEEVGKIEGTFVRKESCVLVNEQNEKDHKHLKESLDRIESTTSITNKTVLALLERKQ